MTRIRTVACLCFAWFSLAAQALPSDPPSITQAELVRRTQQLYDAVAPGVEGLLSTTHPRKLCLL
jgi:hypothetical protein